MPSLIDILLRLCIWLSWIDHSLSKNVKRLLDGILQNVNQQRLLALTGSHTMERVVQRNKIPAFFLLSDHENSVEESGTKRLIMLRILRKKLLISMKVHKKSIKNVRNLHGNMATWKVSNLQQLDME